MLKTPFGIYDGNSWELLCQRIFKMKYHDDGYQSIPASPGDFGLEGFTHTGYAFQCYCPNANYSSKELYEKQRDKITEDLNKLKKYQSDLIKRLGSIKLKKWVFVTPMFGNNLLEHACNKEKIVKSWSLPFLTEDFSILIQDGDSYYKEINEVQTLSDKPLFFGENEFDLLSSINACEEPEHNILRKTERRLAFKKNDNDYETKVKELYEDTLGNFLENDHYLKKIEETAPDLYYILTSIIEECAKSVAEKSTTWEGTPAKLTDDVKKELESRIRLTKSLNALGEHNIMKISRCITAYWLARCELDYNE